MRYFKLRIETPYAGTSIEEEFEMEDDATEDQIEEGAREIVFNHIEWGHHEVDKDGNSLE